MRFFREKFSRAVLVLAISAGGAAAAAASLAASSAASPALPPVPKTTPGVNYSTPALTQAPLGAPPLPPNPTWWGPIGSDATSQRPSTILMTGPDGKIERNPDGTLRTVPLPSGPPAPPPGAPPLGTWTGY